MWINEIYDFEWNKEEFWNSFWTSKELLENLWWQQQFSTVNILEGIRSKNEYAKNWTSTLNITNTGLIKIAIDPKGGQWWDKKSPINLVVKENGRVNVRMDQHQHDGEFYYTHSETDYAAANYYVNWFNDTLEWKSPDDIFGKSNHRLEKHDIQEITEKKDSELSYYNAWKHMEQWFVPFNDRPENQI